MDAIDLIILIESDAAAAAGAAQSITRLYNLVGGFKDRRDALNRLYAELGALRKIVESLRMSLDDSSNRITKGQQQIPTEYRRLLEACKTVCDKFYVELSDVIQHSTPSERMNYNPKLQCKASVTSDAAAKLRIWKMNLRLVAEAMQFKPDGADMAKAHQVEIAIENFRQAISTELDHVDSELKSTGEWLGSLDEMNSAERSIAYQMLLPLRVRQAALSQSIGMCDIAAEALKNRQTPEFAESIAAQCQPRLTKALSFY